MADNNTVARPYAQAVFEVAQENNALDELSQSLAAAKELMADGQVAAFLARPALNDDERLAFLQDLFAKAAVLVGLEPLDDVLVHVVPGEQEDTASRTPQLRRQGTRGIKKAESETEVPHYVADALRVPERVADDQQHCSFPTNCSPFITPFHARKCALCRNAENPLMPENPRKKPSSTGSRKAPDRVAMR